MLSPAKEVNRKSQGEFSWTFQFYYSITPRRQLRLLLLDCPAHFREHVTELKVSR